MTIAITGASGQLGKLVLEELLQQQLPPDQIVALVRSPEKLNSFKDKGITVRAFDYGSEPQVLQQALQDVETLLLISSSDTSGDYKRFNHHKAVIDAAKGSGVKTVVYTSILHAETSTMELAADHKDTEAYLKKSGLSHVFLRNGWYIENYFMLLPSALEHGALLGAAKDGKFSAASRADFAAATVQVLLKGAKAQSSIYELAGDHAFTLAELSAYVAEISGKKVVYVDKSKDDLAEIYKSVGLPAAFAANLAQSDEAASRGDLFDESHDLRKLIGRNTEDWHGVIKKFILEST